MEQMKETAATQDVSSYPVQMEHVLMQASDVMAKLIAEILLMKQTALMQLAEAISSLVQVAAAFIRAGYVMEMMIVKIMKMKEDVKVVIMNATQESGPALGQGIAFQLGKCVMELQTALGEKMKLTSLLADTVTYHTVLL